MKTSTSHARALVAASVAAFGLGIAGGAQAQPAPAKPKAAKAAKPATKTPRAKMMTPRMMTATQTATGKPLTPELKAQLNTAYQARQAAIEAANQKYYSDFAALTGLTADQAREIDKPARVAKEPTAPKVETKTNTDNLTTGTANPAPVVSPANP